ncbi:DMT family transporter [Zoogloea sp.]|uniref:DMT family transporter n=1 Tax=Zoogloea sp. TaxID=49181 RepID=UPI002622AA8B|nr:DMT family transporter [Zoogloea sp.]
MREMLMALAALAGAALPIQAAINGQLRSFVGSPVLTSLISFFAGTVVLAAVHFGMQGGSLPSVASVARTSPWMWLGGPLGTLFVLTAIIVTPRIGAASMIALVVAGQLCMALVLDHFGWIGLPGREVGAMRILGAGLLLAGAVLITRN